MTPLPTLRQLRFLVAVVERCHFGAAAEECLVSQSALSAAIQELEDHLGVKLLERTKRVVIPTAIGLDIAQRARALLHGAEELVEAAREARDPQSGSLQLGVIPTIGPFLVARIMPALREAFPRLRIYLREEQSAPILARLDSGQADAAIIALPYPAEGLETMELARDRFFVVVPPDHRLASREKIRPGDLEAEDLLLLEDGHCLRQHALAACSLEGARRNRGFQGTSLHTLVQMAANGLGVTLVPQMAIDAGILGGLNLVARPLQDDSPPRVIALAWRLTSSRKAMFRELGGVLRKVLEQGDKEARPAARRPREKAGS